jgi:type I restriction enzyme R subunit
MKEKLDDHEELREVMSSNNTRDNMKYKFEQVVDELLLDFVNSKLELYKKLSEPRVNTMFKSRWFEGYQKQLQSEDRIGSAPV